MTDRLGRLPTVLADRDAVEREPGRGGTEEVYLARDEKVGRDVAPKGLRPELAAARGADCFLRGIEIAATLSYPTILPLHDGGEAAATCATACPS
jgi:serine/threonine-protein kinase